MKSYIFSLIGIVSITLSACQKFLDLNPLDQIFSMTFWETKSDFDMALTANYASMQASMWSYEMPNWDCLTDNSYGQHNYGSSKDIASGSITFTTGGYMSGVIAQVIKPLQESIYF